jgi:hypothetical protein
MDGRYDTGAAGQRGSSHKTDGAHNGNCEESTCKEGRGKEGGTESNAFIAGKNALLCYSEPNPTLDSATAGMTFAWTGFPGASSAGTLVRTMRIDQEYTDEIHGFMSFDMKVVSADLGYFFSGIVA